jgi:hypothetical protein
MTAGEFNTILESRPFESTKKGRDEHFIISFYNLSLLRQKDLNDLEKKYISEYVLVESDNGFKMTFQNTEKGIWTNEFKNVKVVSGNIVEWINIDRYVTDDDYDVILVGL